MFRSEQQECITQIQMMKLINYILPPLWKENINLIIIAESSFFCKFLIFVGAFLFRIKLHDATSMCIFIPPNKNSATSYELWRVVTSPPMKRWNDDWNRLSGLANMAWSLALSACSWKISEALSLWPGKMVRATGEQRVSKGWAIFFPTKWRTNEQLGGGEALCQYFS